MAGLRVESGLGCGRVMPGFGGSSPIRRVVNHRLQSAVSGHLRDLDRTGRSTLADIRTGIVHRLIRWISDRNGQYQTSYRNPPMGKIVFARRACGCFVFPSPLLRASLRRSDDFPRRRCGMGWRRSSGHWVSRSRAAGKAPDSTLTTSGRRRCRCSTGTSRKSRPSRESVLARTAQRHRYRGADWRRLDAAALGVDGPRRETGCRRTVNRGWLKVVSGTHLAEAPYDER